MTLKYSRQRQAVWDFIQTRSDHPTASIVYEEVRRMYPNISLGTVYRNLMLLRDMGKIGTVDIGDNAVHFDPNISLHEHFVCRKCGSLTDLDTYDLSSIRPLQIDFHGKIENYSMIFYGICEDCLKQQASTENSENQSIQRQT